MKIAVAAKSSGRNTLRERQKRDRAGTPPLRVRYPQLATLQIDFAFNDRSEFLPSPQVTVFHPPAHAYFCFACPYSDCDGEFDLTQPVDAAVHDRQSRSGGQLRCTGTRHGGSACTLCLEFTVVAHPA